MPLCYSHSGGRSSDSTSICTECLRDNREREREEREDRRRREDERIRERESWKKDKEAKADREREASEARDRQRSLDNAASDAAATLGEAKKQTRIIMEQSYSEDYVYEEGRSGKYAKYALRADGTINITFEEAYISGRVVAFNKGCEDHKKQFSDPGIEYIDTQIKDMVSELGGNPNEEEYSRLDNTPHYWKSDERETTIYYKQKGEIFSLQLGFPKLSFGVVRMEIPDFGSRYLSLSAILEAEPRLVDRDQSLCFLDISFTDGTISFNPLKLEGLWLFEHSPRLIDVFAEGFSGVLSRFNEDAAKKERKEVINQLDTKLKAEKERQAQKLAAEKERQAQELAAEKERQAQELAAEKERQEQKLIKNAFVHIFSVLAAFFLTRWLPTLLLSADYPGDSVPFVIYFLAIFVIGVPVFVFVEVFAEEFFKLIGF